MYILIVLHLENDDKCIKYKDFGILNTRFTLTEPKQTCIWSVFIGKTCKEKAKENIWDYGWKIHLLFTIKT